MSQSQNEERKAWFKGMRKLKFGIQSEMRSAFIAKVIKYDKKKHLADIQPLVNFSDGTEQAQLLDVPVAENCYIIDEILERFKPDYQATDTNSKIPAHDHSNFVPHYRKKPFMRAGVPVVAVILDRDNDNWSGGRSVDTFTPETNRLHDINDAVVIGVLGGDAING
ncbi:hypothetical protein EJK17_08985 [Lactobacillus xujianguonis]|uniref:PH domain-containing protein n=1 Tax=Lactobacillus xujianguonis TaxID=2495899 RepID=A0A437ST82_9LACO|nr:hypothetical protein [Lactobacillus xujianguonis]RVU70156.1 hypothetical protein EJK17_08985 [Lactobacillus xujianguonis]RVU73539.1 hypothetical protein EJK20_07855 [Lactobacillus xujianguonis]